MLTADQIEALSGKAAQLLEPVTEFLISDIAQRITEAGQLTSTAAYQVWRLQQLGVSQRQLKKELRKRLKVSGEELEKLLKQAAEVGYNFDISNFPTVGAIPFAQNGSVQQIVNAAVQLAQEDLTNITQTMGFVTHDGTFAPLTEAYQKSCDYAFTQVSTGARDYNSAIREATRNLANKGIQTIDYDSGVHTSVEAAVRRNVMGGLGLMQEQISQQNHDDLGCDGWEISAHAASAPDHEPIQGKQYSDAEYKNLNGHLHRQIGTLNCGHAAFPIILGVNSPQYTPEELEQMRQENEKGVDYNGKHYTMYEATQRQRSIERGIRKQKRRILVDEETGDPEKLQTDQIRYQVLNQEYKRFSKAAGLRLQRERMEVAGFGPKQARAAERFTAERAADSAEAKKFFGVNSEDDLKTIVKRSTIKIKNGFACFPDGDPLNTNVKKVAPLQTHFDVAMHGSQTSVGFGTAEANMSARTLASVIRHSKGYTGQKIRLLSCNTGKPLDGENCFAEELANALGVEVMAPDNVLYISKNGELRVGEFGEGKFITYIPNQRRRIK